MTTPPLKEWICFIYHHNKCQQAHHRAQRPGWKGDPYPRGHDRCGWFEIAEQGDKCFADE